MSYVVELEDMGSDARNHFLLACRYVPYDQWFLTNISPSWKIKHVKESIIAKAFNLPFDRPLLIKNASTARTPSSNIFGPIEGILRESEVFSELGSHDVADKTQADYGMQVKGGQMATDFNIPGFISEPTTSQAELNSEGGTPTVEPSFMEDKDQIYTSVFTLIRFSTGQILEEPFFVSWYNLEPHELVELHCSSPPTTFAQALVFGPMLINGGSITVDVPTSSVPGSATSSNSNSDRHASSSLSSNLSSKSATLSLAHADPLRLSNLPRHDLASYSEPYWEGWVRVLCVTRRSEMDRSPTRRFAETTSSSGPTFSPEETLLDSGLRRKDETWTKVKEWTERWAVIRNGVLRLCKKRDDPTWTRLPLSALVSLCGAEFFSENDQLTVNLPGGGSGGDNHARPASSHSNVAPTIRAYRSATISDPSRPVEIDRGAGKFLLTTTSSKSATAPRVLSPLMTQPSPTRVVANTPSPLLTTPIDPNFSKHNYSNTLLPIDPERSRRERAAVRELEHARMQKEMAKKARLYKQVENIRWDDLGKGIAFGGKSKAKSKEKEKEREKDSSGSGRGREEKLQNATTGPLISPVSPEKDKVRNDARPQEKDRQREKSQRHRRDHFFHPDDRYIPASREDAIANGMLTVCAKFRIGNVDDMDKDRNKDQSWALNLLRDVGLDGSIASNEGEESGSKNSRNQEDKRRPDRNVEWQRSPLSESNPMMTSLPPPKKASLPGLGLSMLNSGGNMTPTGSIFGAIFGNKEKDNANVLKTEKQDGSYVKDGEDKRNSDDGPIGLSMKPPEMKRLNLSVNTATLERDAGMHTALSSSYYATDFKFDEGSERRRYRVDGYERHDEYRDQGGSREEKMWTTKDQKFEWFVLDMGTEIAYNSFLCILHRHFPPPIQSSFVHKLASAFPSQSPYPSHNAAPQQDVRGVPLALPYPEWRRDVVFRARSQGMRESGRPLELALNLETQPPYMAQERRKQKEPGVKGYTGGQSPSKLRKDEVSKTDYGSDHPSDLESLMLDDSDAESEDESALWWQDIPRQLSSEERHFEWATMGQGSLWSGAEDSPSSPNIQFIDPFAFSSGRPDSTELMSGSPVLGLHMEERLRPSVSASTLASSNTTSSMSGIPWQNSPESHQFRSYPRRVVSPSQTLSSPSSNESLGSNPYHRFPPRPFSPTRDFHLPSTYRQSSGSTSVLHHSVSMPNASALRTMPAGGSTQRSLMRERTVTGPTFFSKPSLAAAQIRRTEVDVDVPLSSDADYDSLPHDDFSPNRSILTLSQIHQIEVEAETKSHGAHTLTFGTDDTTEHDASSPSLDESFPGSSDFGRGEGSLAWNNITRRPMNIVGITSPSSFRDQDYMCSASPRSVSDSASISAKAILRRVRSGSSLQSPMEVHFEEYEEDGFGI